MRLFCILMVFMITAHAEDLFSLSWDQNDFAKIKNIQNSDTFLGPQAIAVDNKENVYLLCNFAKQVLVFSPAGEILDTISYNAEGCGLAVSNEEIAIFSPMAKSITWIRGEHQGTTKIIDSLPSISEVWQENNTWFARCGWQVISIFSEKRDAYSISANCFPQQEKEIAIYGESGHTVFTTSTNTTASVPVGHANSLGNVYTIMQRKLYLCTEEEVKESIVIQRSIVDVFCNYYVKNNNLYQMLVTKQGILVTKDSLQWTTTNTSKVKTQNHMISPSFENRNTEVDIQNIPTYIDVFFRNENVVRTVRLQDYLKNVVSAEIYGSWSLEAHKAMAVAARAYTIGRKRHSDAQICTSTHCQAWKADINTKAAQAVDSTNGIAIYHNGRVIGEALYFAHCNGRTRNSEEKWNYNPYLRSKVCSCGHNEYYGHGVGACQYGLQSYSNLGWSYKQILEHYFTGTIVK